MRTWYQYLRSQTSTLADQPLTESAPPPITMCGIFGYLGPEPLDLTTIGVVHELQRHRGPDDQNSWSGQVGTAQLTLAFERLAIIDLSANANQPFHSASGSVLVYNGEIYNYVELRRELEAAG